MDTTNKLSSFLSEDAAYLLGLIVGRGTIVRTPNLNRLSIDFPFKNLQAVSPLDANKKYDTQMYLSNSLDGVVERLRRLGLDVSKVNNQDTRSVSLILSWRNSDLTWQLLEYILNGTFCDYHSFRIPKAIYQADNGKQKEFLRGYFDVTGYVRASNARFGKDNQQRIYLEVDHRNWFLTLDLYVLLSRVGVLVESIDYGHPNFRDPLFKKSAGFWAKEHQLKIFADQFIVIGSYLRHKQEVLNDLAIMNEEKKEINAVSKRFRVRIKESNAEENSDRLPSFLKGRHFNHYSEILACLKSNDSIKAYE